GIDCPTCVDPVLCGDGILNGYETGIDCYDGTDGASSCPPCQTLCNDNIQNGFETDTDCGGPDCGPCGDETTGFITYLVNGELYESKFTSFIVQRTPAMPPTSVIDLISFGGGINHPINFFLKDSDLTPNTFSTGTYFINNADLTGTPNTCTFTDTNGQVYQGETDPTGITVTITTCQYTAPLPPPANQPGGLFEGTFEGVVFDQFTGESLVITEGVFKLNFQNLSR
ncbi:MAG: hypothetical protein HKO93_01825, partial [Flavobacteriales bacterium]|nr:hypothetical protein [Flavobacteriales bacterium]